MKNKIILFVALFLIEGSCFGQITLEKVIYLDSEVVANAMEQTTDSGYIIVGQAIDSSNNWIVCLIKTNEQGDTLWTKTYTYIDDDALGNSVKQTTDGGYIITGSTDESIFLIKTDTNGDTLWTRTYDGDEAYSVAQTNDSGYIITGYTYKYASGLNANLYLIKTDPYGNIIWTKVYGDSNFEEGCCIKQTADGGYIICGYAGIAYGSAYLVKTNINGDTLWTKFYEGSDMQTAYDIQQTTDGGYIIAGIAAIIGSGWNIFLIKTDAYGDTLWCNTYGGNAPNDYGASVQQTIDGGYIVTGTNNLGSGNGLYIVKVNAVGTALWSNFYSYYFNNNGSCVRQTPDGGYIIAGTTSTSPNDLHFSCGIYLIKTDSAGNSNCYETTSINNVSAAPFTVGSTNTIVGSGGIASPFNPIVGSGSYDTTLCLTTSINEQSINNSITLYPNPAQNELIIKSAELKIAAVAIYNVLGQVCQQSKIVNRTSEIEFDVSSLSSGVYFVRIASEKELWTGKFVKE